MDFPWDSQWIVLKFLYNTTIELTDFCRECTYLKTQIHIFSQTLLLAA